MFARPGHLIRRIADAPNQLGEPARIIFHLSAPSQNYGGWNEDGTRGGETYPHGFDIMAATVPLQAESSEVRKISGAGVRIEGARKFYLICSDFEAAIATATAGLHNEVAMQANYDAALTLLDKMLADVAPVVAGARALYDAAVASGGFTDRQLSRANPRRYEPPLQNARDLRAELPADMPADQVEPTIVWATQGIQAASAQFPGDFYTAASTAAGAAVSSSSAAFRSVSAYAALTADESDPDYARARAVNAQVSADARQLSTDRFALGPLWRRQFPDWRGNLMNAAIEYRGETFTVHAIDEWGHFCEVVATRKAE